MYIFKELNVSEQSKIMRFFLRKQRFYRGLLEAEKDRRNIKDIEQQRIISNLQTHIDIITLAMQDLELIERYVIEQSYYDGMKHKSISEKLNMNISDIGKISSKALKKIRLNLCSQTIYISDKDKIKKGMF